MSTLSQAPHRRSLADRLFHRVLHSTTRSDDLLNVALPRRLADDPHARRALREAVQVTGAREPGTIHLGAGNQGLVLLLHGPTWSLLAPATTRACPVLVCVDDPHSRCLHLADPDDRDVVNTTLYEVTRELVVQLFGR